MNQKLNVILLKKISEKSMAHRLNSLTKEN